MEATRKLKGKKNIKTPSIPFSSPVKSLPPKPSAAAAASDQIGTPEKPVNLPPRTRNRSVALSIKEVKQIAQGLQRNNTRSSDRSDLARPSTDLDLVSVEIPKPPRAKTHINLPEKYETLAEFFNSMDSSIRLLRMKGSSPTFPNISASIQNLTERRFTYGHLAQLKYILPEAIVIKKVLLHDEVTSCMKPELHVALQVDAFEDEVMGKGENGYSVLRRVFRERLADFSKRHPEGDEIPEEQLPHPFNQTQPNVTTNEPRVSSTVPPIISSRSNVQSTHEFAAPSHMSRSFQRRFSQRIHIPDAQKTPLACSSNASSKEDSHVSVAMSPMRCTSKPPLRRKSLLCPILSSPSSTLRTDEEEEAKLGKECDDVSQNQSNSLDGTPAKLVSTPARLMTVTPEIKTPKRRRSSIDCVTTPQKKSAKRSIANLLSTPKKKVTEEDEETKAESSLAVDDILGFLPKSLLQSIREKERKALEEKDAGVAEAKKRQKLIASLPSTFDMILLIFQSSTRSVLTKQELTHKIISNHCKIVDRGEVEEQLKLLQELIPDWIYEETESTGDILYSVNKLSSPGEPRQRLVEAV